jgi:hypothetical protein
MIGPPATAQRATAPAKDDPIISCPGIVVGTFVQRKSLGELITILAYKHALGERDLWLSPYADLDRVR